MAFSFLLGTAGQLRSQAKWHKCKICPRCWAVSQIGTARCPRKRPRGDGGGAPPGVMPPATLAQRARGAAPAAGPKPKKPWRRQAHRGPAPLPLRALAWFLALPSNILLLCVAAGWYVGVVWLAPGTPSGWIHSVAYSIVVLSFFGAFVACVLSTWLRG